MTAWQVAAFAACVALAAGTQSITGFAMALVLLGLTSLFELAPLPDAANVATVLGLVSAMVALRGSRHRVDWPIWRSTVSGSVLGVAAGVALLAWLNNHVVVLLRLLLGIVVIGCALVVLLRAAPRPERSSRLAFHVTGLLSGLLGGLFSASGPPVVYTFYRQPISVDAVRDTLVATLAVGSLLRLLMVVPSGQFGLRSLSLCAVAVPVTVMVTWWLRRHPPAWPRETVLKIVCALLMVTGTGLIVPAVRVLAAR